MNEAVAALVEELYSAKLAEEEAKNRRVALEAAIAKELEVPEQWEGSQTRTVNDYKVCVRRSMYVKVDVAKLKEITARDGLDEAAKNAFRWKAELDKKGWGALDANTQAAFSEAITKTPGKVSVSVDLKENKEDK